MTTNDVHRLTNAVGSARAMSWFLSAAAVSTITIVLSLFVPALWHWMIVPTTAAGVLVGVDVVDWIRRRTDSLQPRALVGIFGLHLCYFSPLLHVVLDHWPRYVQPAHDWRTSLGILALVNTTGLVLYRVITSVRQSNSSPVARLFDAKRFQALAGTAAAVGFLAFIVVLTKFGGPVGYLRIVSENRAALTGNGWLLIIAESWPLLLFALVIVSQRRWLRTHLVPLVLVLVAFVFVQFLTAGLRGSRANTVWPTLMAMGLIHIVVRPIGRRILVAGVLVLLAFMYVYGFYKAVGADVLGLARQQTTTSALASQTGRTFTLLLLEDFGRAGTQAIVVDRLVHGGKLAGGVTYVGDVVKLTPDSLVPHPPVDKVAAGTDLLYVPGAYDAGIRSSRIFGLAGEGMLNFGLIGGALAFIPFGFFVRWADNVWQKALVSTSMSLPLIAPGLGTLCLLALGSDLDNVLWLMYSQVLPLAVVVYLSGSRPTFSHVHKK